MKERTREEIEMEFDMADRLYHYTSIDNMKKIIDSKALMFNRNDKLNDVVEGLRTESFQSNYYTTCFTTNSKESIPLWYMYGKGKLGIRISVKNRNFFTGRVYYLNGENKIYFKREEIEIENDKPIYANIVRTKYGYIKLGSINRTNVYYSDEEVEKDPTTILGNKSIEVHVTDIYKMAGVKGGAWSFEEEARFFTTISDKWLNINSLFYELSDDFFNEMIITINPFLNNEEMERIENDFKKLLSSYNITFSKSKLTGKIRI